MTALLQPADAIAACATLEVQPLTRSDAEVFAAFQEPLRVVTPPQHITAVDHELKTAHVDASPSVRDFIWALEQRVTDLVVAKWDEWFPLPPSAKKAEQDGDVIRSRFKSFFLSNGDYRFKLPGDAEAFDEAGEPVDIASVQAGTRARVVLEVGRISFGKREYGIAVRIKQIRVARQPVCLIVDEDQQGAEAEQGYDSDFM